MEIVNKINEFLTNNAGMIGAFMGILFSIAKGISNEKAGPVVAAIQKVVDMVASLFVGIGSALKAISGFLANLIKSDGFLGKK